MKMTQLPNLTRQLIQGNAGISDMEYSEKVFSSAYMYLEICFRATEDEKNKLVKNAWFWKWWMRQWNLREEALVGRYLIALSFGEAPDLLKEWHKAHAVINLINIIPNKWALSSVLHVINRYETTH